MSPLQARQPVYPKKLVQTAGPDENERSLPGLRSNNGYGPGFYYGAGYVSYALAVAITVATFIACWVIVGFSLNDNRLFWWMGMNAVILMLVQPPLMRVSRTIWLYLFTRYSHQWKQGDTIKGKRVNEELKNAW